MAAPVPLRGFVLRLFPRTPQRSPSAPLALLLRRGQHSPGSTGTKVGLVPLVQRRWGNGAVPTHRSCLPPPPGVDKDVCMFIQPQNISRDPGCLCWLVMRDKAGA